MKKTMLAAVLAAFGMSASAAYLFDTGTPQQSPDEWTFLDYNQGLGFSFAVSGPATITSVDVYFRSLAEDSVQDQFTVSLFMGSPNSQALRTATIDVPAGNLRWHAFDIPDVAVGAGVYTIAVTANSAGNTVGQAPNPGVAEWVKHEGAWGQNPTNHGFGFRVSAVPEPSTYMLMLGGIAVLGASARLRRKRQASR